MSETRSSVNAPALDQAAIALLRAAHRGPVVAAEDEEWEASRRPWHSGVDQQPALVAHVADAADVEAVVRWAQQHGLAVAAQPRGHGATAHLDGTVLVRTAALDEIAVDAARRTARVGAGVSWQAMFDALDGTGLVALSGSNPSVTVVGLMLGGGLSWFGRAFGTPASSLLAVDLVDATGTSRTVTAESDPDLFWALRGGGGDFGVVTAVEIALHPAPELYGGRLAFAGEQAPEVLRAWAEVTRTAPDELATWAMLMHLPDLPQIPEEVRGRSFMSVDVMFVGLPDEAEALLAPLRAVGPTIRETVRALRASEIGGIAEEPVEPGPPMRAVSHPFDVLDDDVLEHVLATAGVGSGTPLVGVQMRHLGGAQAAADPSTGPGAQIRPGYVLAAMAPAFSPEAAAVVDEALRGLVSAVPRSEHGLGITFLQADQPIEDAYGAEAVGRLREVKQAVDPDGLFRSNHPVHPVHPVRPAPAT
ncbi:FAD-binding oxidoreductase [Cellulomonas chengniuliangii]|uniref:FAD-binding oxidoreductase n=1 Tax=Cellulomonas chengniuliangii TaxID=2968084 RepID=UPI001D0E6A4F|nr:FAD-binding oxidoreductase [Cellulomonas chengniuliangii]MCC2318493.1 FAD-binding oxidoreductase [Cellulomonas chengniuliangii]